MQPYRLIALLSALLLPVSGGLHAQPAEDLGYDAAAYLIAQTTRPYPDGRHNVMLRSLRMLEDPGLLPLFEAMQRSAHAPQRVHGLLGMAELSPNRRLDLALLAEVDDRAEVVQVISAAMDDELIGNAEMAQLLSWEALDLAARQAIALRLIAEGGAVDPAMFRESLNLVLDDQVGAGRLLQYGLAALLLAQLNDPAGPAALDTLLGMHGGDADAVLAQLLDASLRRELSAAGPVAMHVAKDNARGTTLRFLAMQTALRLDTEGAEALWKRMLAEEQEPARRTRLALIALDASPKLTPSIFDALLVSDDELIRTIAEAGQAVANGQANLPAAFAPLLATGQPLAVNWVVLYCRREEPAEAPQLLEMVIRAHVNGEASNRTRLIEPAVAATQLLCESYPDQTGQRLPAMLTANIDEPDALALRQIVLLGAVRARGVDLAPLAIRVPPMQGDFTSEMMGLLVRARYGVELSRDEWARVSDVVQGVGQMDLGLRVQLAWLYLEHRNSGRRAIEQATRGTR